MSDTTTVVNIPLNEILFDDDLNEGRGKIAPIDVAQLMNDIQEHGLIQPVILSNLTVNEQAETGKVYRLVAGYRRGYSFMFLGKPTIPAIIRGELSELDARLLNLSENLQRQDLNILQEARAIKRLRDLGLTREEIAEKTNTSSGWVQVRVMLLDLPEDVQQEAASGRLKQTHIRELTTIVKSAGKSAMYEAVRLIKEKQAKGEKEITVNPKRDNPNIKLQRKKGEMFRMMDHIRKYFGNGIQTRTLAWAAGEISSADLYDTLEELAVQRDIDYQRPE